MEQPSCEGGRIQYEMVLVGTDCFCADADSLHQSKGLGNVAAKSAAQNETQRFLKRRNLVRHSAGCIAKRKRPKL